MVVATFSLLASGSLLPPFLQINYHKIRSWGSEVCSDSVLSQDIVQTLPPLT